MATITVESIHQLHQLLQLPAPKHPLISLVNANDFQIGKEHVGTQVLSDFYMISLKDKGCGIDYGRSQFDFQEGVLVFSAPKQLSAVQEVVERGSINGWMLFFHPDLIRGFALNQEIENFNFFSYDVVEALHLSQQEEATIQTVVQNIENEYNQRIDKHSQKVIVSNLELLLNYCDRYYERQFTMRSTQNKGFVKAFEQELAQYFNAKQHLENGLPSIAYFSEKAHLSQHYFSDLLKKETGRSAKDHINDFIINQAKNLLVNSNLAVNEIAFELGFNYPHYFTRLFKSKTGVTPVEFKNLN